MSKNKLPISLASFTLALCVGFEVFSSASAATPTISKAYTPKGSIADGSIVRLVTGLKNTVATANSSNQHGLIGVKQASNGSLLAINPSSTTIQVAISGSAETLVSTINGNIKQGDYVAVSPFGGMGMESSPGDYDIGIAISSFNSKSSGAKEQRVTNKNGQSTEVWTGEIPVSIAIGFNSGGNANLNGLQKLASSITGHVISTGRIIAALILAVLAFATIVTLSYAATYGSIISIGRNPLAKYEIIKGLRSITLALVGVAVVSSLLIYLLLS